MALQNFIKQAVGYLHTSFRHREERVGGQDGPIVCIGDTITPRMQCCSRTVLQGISREVEDKYGFRTMLETSKGTTLVKHAATTDASCSKDTESSDDLIVKQRMLIQQLVEKTQGMTQKIARLERVIHQLDADHQGNVKMLDVAKDFFDSFKPTRAANGAVEFFSEDDEDIVQRINHMKDFFSYFIPSDRVKSKGMGKVA